ncbi:MAG: hypothetical protein WDM88_01090 [Galbitalea sp.]
MTSALAAEAFQNLTIEFAEEDGVTITDEGLAVHGTIFAFLRGTTRGRTAGAAGIRPGRTRHGHTLHAGWREVP